MAADTFFAAVPDAAWLPFIGVALVLIYIAEKIISSFLSLSDRKSDTQLLEQADKAVSIVEKLPEGHETRSELLRYLSAGPVAELTERQANRHVRKLEAKKRNLILSYGIGSLVLVGIIWIPQLPGFYEGFFSESDRELNEYNRYLLYVAATMFFFVTYLVMSFAAFVLGISIDKLGDLMGRSATYVWKKIAQKLRWRRSKKQVSQPPDAVADAS